MATIEHEQSPINLKFSEKASRMGEAQVNQVGCWATLCSLVWLLQQLDRNRRIGVRVNRQQTKAATPDTGHSNTFPDPPPST